MVLKRAGIILLALMITLMSASCSSVNNKLKQNQLKDKLAICSGYKVSLDVKNESTQYSFEFTRKKPLYYQVEFSKPAEIKGFILEVNDKAVTLKYSGLSIPLDYMPFPIKTGIGRINDMLINMDTLIEKYNVKQSDTNTITLSGKINDDADVEIKLRLSDSLPVGFKIVSSGKITDVTINSFEFF